MGKDVVHSRQNLTIDCVVVPATTAPLIVFWPASLQLPWDQPEMTADTQALPSLHLHLFYDQTIICEFELRGEWRNSTISAEGNNVGNMCRVHYCEQRTNEKTIFTMAALFRAGLNTDTMSTIKWINLGVCSCRRGLVVF